MANNKNSDYKVKDLVLAGGGHSHVQVLKRLAMKPVGGLRVTLISSEVHTPYSGMLPGYIAGHYDWNEIHIDLAPLCARAGARLIAAPIQGLDLDHNLLHCGSRAPVRFDLLSINCGSAPLIGPIDGADRFGISVKPINRFLPRWQRLLDRLRTGGDERFRLGVVGGGAGGVELALSIGHRLTAVEKIANVDIFLVTADQTLLADHSPGVQVRLKKELARAAIDVHCGVRIVAAESGRLRGGAGETLPVDEVLWVTQAAAQPWPAAAGLAVDAAGFIRVNENLQSISHARVFAAGDIAGIDGHPRPKSGVFAVRQGPVLSENLRRMACGRRMIPYRPQKYFLSLISTGDRRAVASRHRFSARGAWVWRWKNWIDRRFVAGFHMDDQAMETAAPRDWVPMPDGSATQHGESGLESMRCGGCGAKLGGDLLARVLARLRVSVPSEVVNGIGDDAAILRPVVNSLEVQTIDGFRAMIDDPYLLGRIAAEHSINDVYAMGGLPRTALASVAVPYAAESLMEDDLYQLMAGTVAALESADASLVGGHSGEGAELSVSLAVTGTVYERDVWQKQRISVGDCLVLTKPVGTGVLLAAHMRARCQARWLVGALEHMQQSNKNALTVLREAGIRACTDITGFGVLGHIDEMARAAKLGIEIWPRAVPTLPGARDLMRAGIASSLQKVNERALAEVDVGSFACEDIDVRMLLDPQTSGGLVAAVRPDRVNKCIVGLHAAGYSAATVIGRVGSAPDDGLWAVLAEEVSATLRS